MGKPAARLGDITAHGGAITVGFPTVIIGGKPAARLGDMHVCPMMNPGPSPHVGGPVAIGSAMVLIGGMPAARLGDMVTCSGPPDSVAMGCPTVLIGEAGSDSGSGGEVGTADSDAAAVAQMGVAAAQFDNNETSTQEEHWIEFEFVDKAGNLISGIPYKFTDSAGNTSESVLRLDGKIRRDGLDEGECKVEFFNVSNARWSKEKAKVGEKVKLSAEVEGCEADTPAFFQIYQRNVKGSDYLIATIQTETQAEKVETQWEYAVSSETDNAKTPISIASFPPPIKPLKEPRASDSIPFAPPPAMGSYWPVATAHKKGREVAYQAIDGSFINKRGRRFLANRLGGKRNHVGVDLFANIGDKIVACEDGIILGFKPFYDAKSGEKTYRLLIEHANVMVNYGEVKSNSLKRNGLKIGSSVKAGQVIGFVSDTSMLHFETYKKGTQSTHRWMKNQKEPPAVLLNPTKYLLFLQEHGLTGANTNEQTITSSGVDKTNVQQGHSMPEYYFEVIVGERKARSGMLVHRY